MILVLINAVLLQLIWATNESQEKHWPIYNSDIQTYVCIAIYTYIHWYIPMNVLCIHTYRQTDMCENKVEAKM